MVGNKNRGINDTKETHKKRVYARLSRNQVIGGIKGSAAIITEIASRLGCSRKCVYSWLDRDPGIKEAFEQEKESTLDLAEEKLIEQIKEGNLTAIIFFLKCRGKNRGYIERFDPFKGNGEPIKFIYRVVEGSRPKE